MKIAACRGRVNIAEYIKYIKTYSRGIGDQVTPTENTTPFQTCRKSARRNDEVVGRRLGPTSVTVEVRNYRVGCVTQIWKRYSCGVMVSEFIK